MPRPVENVPALLAPLRLRLQRHPMQAPRQDALNALITGWLDMQPREYRLSCDAKLDKGHRSPGGVWRACGGRRLLGNDRRQRWLVARQGGSADAA